MPLPCPGRGLLGLTLRLLLLRLDTRWRLLVLVRVLGVGPANVRILSRSLLMISLVVVVVVMRSVVALGRCNTAGTIIITPILTARTCCPVRVAPGLPAGLPLGPGPRAPPLALRPPAAAANCK